jgi:multidrug efflux pump
VERLLEIGNAISARANAEQKFMFVDIDLKVDLPQAQVIIDRERVADMKLDLAGIAQELGVLLGGGYVNRFNYFNRSYQVIPQLSEADRQSTSSLMDIKIRTPNGQLIPVSSFARIQPLTAPRVLNRFQQQGAIRINAAMLPGMTKVAGPGSFIDYAGESRQIRKEGSTLTVTLGIAIVLIYLVLSAQFKSFRDPLIVLLGSVPLAISGALALTFLGLTTINIYSQVGLITLVGLVAKNGILIVEFANHLQATGRAKWRNSLAPRLDDIGRHDSGPHALGLRHWPGRSGQKQHRNRFGRWHGDRHTLYIVRSSIPVCLDRRNTRQTRGTRLVQAGPSWARSWFAMANRLVA